MTTPNFHPYLIEGDLRTPEDVRDFVASFGNSAFTGEVLRALDERLDRERRQACRRGALRRWQALRFWVKFNTAKAPGYDWNQAFYAIEENLAFREEARKP